MAFGDRIKAQRDELALSRPQLADRLGVTPSTVSNYETGVSFPQEEMMLRLFDCLETDPNTLFQDSFRRGADVLTERERQLLEQYRSLSPLGRESVQTMVEALRACQQKSAAPEQEPRVIPLYRTPAAAGYAAPVFGEDFDYLQVTDGVPQAAEFAVRIQGDSMVPYIPDGSVVYVNRDPLKAGDVGIFCVDGDIFCKQYYKDPAGTVYLFSLNRARADADVVLTAGSGRTLACFGRVILHAPPVAGADVTGEPGAAYAAPGSLVRQSSNDEPAVGGEDLPREERCLVGGQKGNGVGHVLRRPQPSQRRLLRQIPQGPLSQNLNHVGVDDAGSHAVDPDVGGRQLQRQGPGQPHESGFGAGIRHLAGGSPQSPDG